LLLAIAVSGCGGSSAGSSDADQIRGMIQDYTSAIADHNGGAACEKMTPALQQQLVGAIGSLNNGVLKGKSCAELLNLVAQQGGAEVKQAIAAARKLKLVNLKISGDHATMDGQVAIRGTTTSSHYEAHKVNGHWLMSCCLGPGAPAH
jgi:hypothetical protein